MKDIELNGKMIKTASTVDAVGLFALCRWLSFKIEMEKIGLRQVVEFLADDPGVQEDLPAWCRETGNRLLSIKKNAEDIFVAYVEKGVKMRQINFDHLACSPVLPESREAMLPFLGQDIGNPLSRHSFGDKPGSRLRRGQGQYCPADQCRLSRGDNFYQLWQ